MKYALINFRNSFGKSTPPSGISELSQFSLVLLVLFLVVLLPLLNLCILIIAGTTLYLATNDFAAKAATQANYFSVLKSMNNEAKQFQTSGLAKLVQMVPAGGYAGCGNDLYVLATNIANGAVTTSPANKPLAPPTNTTTTMYEISVKSDYSVVPLVSLAALPLLKSILRHGYPARANHCHTIKAAELFIRTAGRNPMLIP